jgi:muramoyltetrapeptide carboxypeptidase
MKIPVLNTNDTIGLIAPAGPIKKSQIMSGVEVLQGAGFHIKFGNNLFNKYRYFSGTTSERLSDLKMMLDDDQVKAIYAVRGGTGTNQLLSHIDFNMWKERKKLLIGFSDITSMQWALWVRAKLGSYSGMTLTSQLRKSNPFVKIFFDFLLGIKTSIDSENLTKQNIVIERSGEAKGILLGGTLSIIMNLLGTPFFPKTDEIILYFEDTNEPLYKIERSLVQLKMAGFMKNIKGLILGNFKIDGFNLEIWPTLHYLFPDNIPVISHFPYGHFKHCCPLPLGVKVVFKTNPFFLSW